MATQVEAARLLTIRAARLKDAGERSDMEAGMAKLFASEAGRFCVEESFRIHGGYGYSKEYEIERLYRDAPLLLIGEGTSRDPAHGHREEAPAATQGLSRPPAGPIATVPPVSGLLSRIDWRPRVLRTTGSVTEGIYGLILAVSVIAISREYESSNAGTVAVTVLVTGVVFWLAHVYARILSRSMAGDRMLTRAEAREVLRHDWPLVEVTIPLVLILLLGALDVVGDETAILLAVFAALLELGTSGAYAARTSGAGIPMTILSAAVAVGLGGAVVLLKVLVH